MNDEYKEKVKNKYYREIYLTKIRIIERAPKLSQEEIKNLEYRSSPRNKGEDEIKENPLMQYSTSQLKAELRRRKKERC